MKMRVNRRLLPWLLALVLLVGSGLCLLGYQNSATELLSQQAAERWRGDNELAFAQISCFMPADELLSEEQIFNFRTEMAKKLVDASFEVEADSPLIHDAWCGFYQVTVSRGQKSAKVSAVTVGGDYFDFHPLRLVSGTYISDDELMEDRVLLDREVAWLLFGGEELSGLSFEINGLPFVVAGVVEREDDRFSKDAYTGGMGIYMSHEAYKKLDEAAGISCYELVMAEPVEGFVYAAAQEKFPIGLGEIVDNTYRYEPERLLRQLKNPSRAMHLGNAVYPYWENAARAMEPVCLRWLLAALALVALPLALMLWLVIKALVFGKRRLEEDYVPAARERIAESWRLRARARWEKKNPHMK